MSADSLILTAPRLAGRERAWGLLLALLAHAVLPLGVWLARDTLGAPRTVTVKPPLPALQAQLIERGIPPKPKQLPKRRVPVKATAPRVPVAQPVASQPAAVVAPALKRPAEPQEPAPAAASAEPAEEDLLKRLGERAQVFAEIAQQQQQEASVDASPDGNAAFSRAGDAYRGRLYSFFKRGWALPALLDRDAARALRATVVVVLSSELRIASFELKRSSGNPLFDEAVIQHLTKMQRANRVAPPPPEDAADTYLNRQLPIRFTGRD